MIPEVTSIAVYLLLLLAALFVGVAQKRSSMNMSNGDGTRLSVALLGVVVIASLLMALGWLPAPSQGWLLPAVPLFAIWCVLGLLVGAVLVRMRSRPRLIIAVATTMALCVGISLFLLRWPFEPNPSVGWGLFAVPPFIAGVLLAFALVTGRRHYTAYITAWLIAVSMVALPHYMMEMDSQELGRAYISAGAAKGNAEGYLFTEVQITVLYVLGTLALLIVPFLVGYFAPGGWSKQEHDRKQISGSAQ